MLTTKLYRDRTKLSPKATGPLLLEQLRPTLTGPTQPAEAGETLTIRFRLLNRLINGLHLPLGLVTTTLLLARRNMPMTLCPVENDPLSFGAFRNSLPGPPKPPWPVTTRPPERVPRLQQSVLFLRNSL